MTRKVPSSLWVVSMTAIAVAVGCLAGCSQERPSTAPSPSPTSSRTWSSTPPSPSTSPAEPGLTTDSVVFARERLDGSRFLMAYGFESAQTRTLVAIGRADEPTVDPTGTAVVVSVYTGRITQPDLSWAQSGTGSHLVLINLDDGSRRALTRKVKGVFDTSPAWNRAGDGWVYFLRSERLLRVQPDTGQLQRVPHGNGISQFVLESGGKTAWVYSRWCFPGDGCGGEWRLNLVTGAVRPHTFRAVVGGDVTWSPDGTWVAYAPNACGVPSCPALYVQRWPDGRRHAVLEAPNANTVPQKWTVFGTVGWQPDNARVVLQTTRLSWADRPYGEVKLLGQRILLVDRTDGSSIAIGPRSVRDQDFDVWSAAD
jgi:hypothetical protein